MERACYSALKGGLYELKGVSKHKLPIKVAWAATSAVQGFRKGYVEPAPLAGGDLTPPGLDSLSLAETPRRASSGVLPSLLRTHSSASVTSTHSTSLLRSTSSGNLCALSRSASGQGVAMLSHSASMGSMHASTSSGNLCGLPRNASSRSLGALAHSPSSGDLEEGTSSTGSRGLPRSASARSITALPRSTSFGDGVGDMSYSPSGRFPLAPAANFGMLGPVHESEAAEDSYADARPPSADRREYGKARRRSLERRERVHPYAAPLRRHSFIAPYHSARLGVPEQPATYPLHVSFGGMDPRDGTAATQLTVAPEAPLRVGADARRLPPTLRAAPRGELTLHNNSSAHVLVRLGGL